MRGRFFDGGQIELGLLPLETPQAPPKGGVEFFVWHNGVEYPAVVTVWHDGAEHDVDTFDVLGAAP